MESHAVVTPETAAAATSSGTAKTPATLATPFLLQLVTQMPIAAARVPEQTAVVANLATPPLLLQLVTLVPVAVDEALSLALVAEAGIPHQRFVLVWEEHHHPFVFHFYGCPGHLAHFLAQAWHHLKCNGGMYPDNKAWVHVVVVNLDKSASEWLVSLHDEDAPELVNLDAFMQAL